MYALPETRVMSENAHLFFYEKQSKKTINVGSTAAAGHLIFRSARLSTAISCGSWCTSTFHPSSSKCCFFLASLSQPTSFFTALVSRRGFICTLSKIILCVYVCGRIVHLDTCRWMNQDKTSSRGSWALRSCRSSPTCSRLNR